MYNFKDKVVLITGGSRGLGLCLAKNFLEEEAKVAIVGKNPDNLAKALKELGQPADRAIAITADVSKEEDIARYVKVTVDAFGRIDVFCNNAGVQQNQAIKDTSLETLQRVWGINQFGYYLGMKHVIPVMEAQKSGVIINTASTDSFKTAATNAVYSSSKFAVLSMTRCAALEEVKYGIRVNAVCPGPINTDLMRDFENRNNPENPQAIIDMFCSQIPMGRYADPQDVANAVLFLASDKASYITGAHLTLDGGWSSEMAN